ncbi:hypothetical protein H7E67_09625 [Clostridium gasigenes]|uniref:hypothetical protein n=1 Tax=Clostridium gasigenes TaxID=94869 RepID=UPI001625E0A2|nr:hypothetical protein [Clostridium gasigenes]MBB6623689.1 hypothetical protein [Clostridium gasigenes]MBU3088821.1 hypothetical protein [Clostridium gasigenes]
MKKNIYKRILGSAVIIYPGILLATKYNSIVFYIGTIMLILLVVINLKIER